MLNGVPCDRNGKPLLVKARITLVVWESVERSNHGHSCYLLWLIENFLWLIDVLIENNWDIGSEKYISIKFRQISKLFRSTKEQECCK